MLNTTNLKLGSNSQSVSFNSPSTGMLQKSHPKSRFVRFQRGSQMEAELFPSDKKNTSILTHTETKSYSGSFNSYKDVTHHEVTVLQIMVFGEDHFLCEVVENEFLTDESIEKAIKQSSHLFQGAFLFPTNKFLNISLFLFSLNKNNNYISP